MKESDLKKALRAAVKAAKAVGASMRKNFRETKTVNEAVQHDIKLALDVQSQELIQNQLLAAFPDIAVLGEEGIVGNPQADARWVVDPIDGTVNFAYQIPHACVSIALQVRAEAGDPAAYEDGYTTLLGVIYEPFTDELWTARAGQEVLLNGIPVRVSTRNRLDESVITIGFSKTEADLNAIMPVFGAMVSKVRKIRIMGSAALALSYIASGRMDAYLEHGVRLWDIAAGGLMVECAGGDFHRTYVPIKNKPYTYALLVNNGLIRDQLQKVVDANTKPKA